MSARTLTTDIAIVGGGPAGLSAATAAATSGARVLLIDAYSQASGQYWMQAADGGAAGAQAAEGRAGIARAKAAGVQLLTGFEVFAAYPGPTLFAASAEDSARIDCKALIVASGAHDRTVALPGWTLPGVMTAGGAQRLAKTQGILSGRRIVLSGSGIFLYAVADTLIAKGAEIAALVEARSPNAALLHHLGRFPERWREATALLRRVRRRVGRHLTGQIVTVARGKDRVEAVGITRLDGRGVQDIDGIDGLLTSFGFQPQIEVTSLLGCEHRFDDTLGGWLSHRGSQPACRPEPWLPIIFLRSRFSRNQLASRPSDRPDGPRQGILRSEPISRRSLIQRRPLPVPRLGCRPRAFRAARLEPRAAPSEA